MRGPQEARITDFDQLLECEKLADPSWEPFSSSVEIIETLACFSILRGPKKPESLIPFRFLKDSRLPIGLKKLES